MPPSSVLLPLLFLLSLFTPSMADLPAVHEKPKEINLSEGDDLSLPVPSPTAIWHRKFSDGREQEYVEACNPYLDVCEKWRSGVLGKNISTRKVGLDKKGTLSMPKVTVADSAQYYTYYFHSDGVHHYAYFDVKVTPRG